jgi:ABC-type sugar transport system ATPase subunit
VLSTDALVVRYATTARRALDEVSIDVADGTTLAVVGPSGAGKTTLLRAIAGLVRVNGGHVRLDGASINRMPPQDRRIALVFQDDALFANMTVRENLRFALRGGSSNNDQRIGETARALHVGDHLDRRPRRLSGGERQRASIARALLSDPIALLLDEPLAHLDPSLRRSVRDEVIGVRQRFAGPILYITHDHVEAMSVADLLAVLVDGRIEDLGAPERVYNSPSSIAVARFLGERPMNLFEYQGVILGIRPERVAIASDGSLSGRIARRENTGADAYLDVATERGTLVVRVPAQSSVHPGDQIALDLPADALRRFESASGKAIA